MQEVVPISLLSSFKAKMIQLTLIDKYNNVSIYQAITSFGNMNLVIEKFVMHPNSSQTNQLNIISKPQLQSRNKLMISKMILSPLIYEQQIVEVSEDCLYCMTLTEEFQMLKIDQIVKLGVASVYENLIMCAYRMSLVNFQYQSDCYKIQEVFKSKGQYKLYLDFTKINHKTNNQALNNFQTFKASFVKLIRQSKKQKMTQLLFIKEIPFVYDLLKVMETKNWFDLAILYNLLPDENVTVINQIRKKIHPIHKLSGKVTFQHLDRIYNDVLFYDGFRIDGIHEVTFQQLQQSFFQEKNIYYITKDCYMTVRKKLIQSGQYWTLAEKNYDSMIVVKSEVSKVEFINFLISYLKHVQPVLTKIEFNKPENILELNFFNRVGEAKIVLLKFSLGYIVKDQEISMIIQKSKLKALQLYLKGMLLTDSFMLFLANCDKLMKINKLDLSYCSGVTENGVNALIHSPFCKNIVSLRVCALPLIDIAVIKYKKNLKELCISQCVAFSDDQFSISDLKIERLEAIGVNISLKMPETIKYLYINSEMALDGLKLLINLQLVEFKVKLVESKKNISNFMSNFNFYNKENPIKIFSEGCAKKSLKLLDISFSTIKIKQLKPILQIQTLEQLICQNIDREKFADVTLSPKIMSLSVRSSKINSNMLNELLSKTSVIIKLNILQTDIESSSLESVLKSKKYIGTLEIGEQQFLLSLFSQKNCVENLKLHIKKFIKDEHECILNNILMTQTEINRALEFICPQKLTNRLISKINRFRGFYKQKSKKMLQQPSISINAIPFARLQNYQNKEQINEHFYVFKTASQQHNHKQKIVPQFQLSLCYGFPILDKPLNIDLFNLSLHKIIQNDRKCLVEVNISNNRVIGRQIINLLLLYAGQNIISIDFRNCLFTFQQVKNQLLAFPALENVNEGEYDFHIVGDNQIENELQNYLKFFIRQSKKYKMKIIISLEEINEKDLCFSVLFEILSYHINQIISLSIKLRAIEIDDSILGFWTNIFTLSNLEYLRIQAELLFENDESRRKICNQFQKLNSLNLFGLEIVSSCFAIMPPQITLKDLRKLNLNLSQQLYIDLRSDINEQAITKLLKNSNKLSHLSLNLSNCPNINSLSRLEDILEKIPNLTILNLDFQNCSIKQGSLLQLISNLKKNILLEKMELNVNNCHIGLLQLAKTIHDLSRYLKLCHFTIYAFEPRKATNIIDLKQMLLQGIEFIVQY